MPAKKIITGQHISPKFSERSKQLLETVQAEREPRNDAEHRKRPRSQFTQHVFPPSCIIHSDFPPGKCDIDVHELPGCTCNFEP